MLRFLRKYSSSTGIKILYGVLAALFVIWGVGAVGGQRVDVVAKVHGETISRRDLDRAAALLQRRYQEVLKGQFSADLARSLDVRGRALDQLIDDALLRHEADRLGMAVGEVEVVDAITSVPELQEDGHFSRQRLEYVLQAERDRGEFEAEVRRNILFERLRNLVVDGTQVSDGEITERYRLDHEQVDLSFVRIAATDLAAGITLTDDDLEHYLAGHPESYRTPARVRLRYVAYRAADFEPQVEVQDGGITEYYELHKTERFTAPEEVHARHILVTVPDGATEAAKSAARTKAEELLTKLRGGGDFAALAKQHSDDPGSAAKGGDLGFFPRGRMTPAFESAAFALEPGKLSDLVETPFGFHIIKVEEHREGGPKPLDEVHDEVVQALRREHALALARQQGEEDRERVVRGRSLSEALAGRTLLTTPPFVANGEIPGLGRVPALSDAAFALHEGEVSDLVETADAYYLLSPFEHTEAHVPPLAEVRDRVLADARRERAATAAKERGTTLRARAAEIGLGAAAAELGLAVKDTGLFDRRVGSIPTIGAAPDLHADAFTLTPEAPLAPKVYSVSGDAIVAALVKRIPADMAGLAAERDRILDSLLQQKRPALLAAYVNYLKERAAREGALEVRSDSPPRG